MNRTTKEVGRYIFKYMKENNGRPPIIREICRNVKGAQSKKEIVPSIAHYHLARLEEAGIILNVKDGTSRNIQIIGATYIVPELPEILI